MQIGHTKADKELGKILKSIRLKANISPLQLGKKVNEKYQDIERFESGAIVPSRKLEDICDVLNIYMPKRVIRKIVSLRKKGPSAEDDLIALYHEEIVVTEEEEE